MVVSVAVVAVAGASVVAVVAVVVLEAVVALLGENISVGVYLMCFRGRGGARGGRGGRGGFVSILEFGLFVPM